MSEKSNILKDTVFHIYNVRCRANIFCAGECFDMSQLLFFILYHRADISDATVISPEVLSSPLATSFM